MNKRIKKQIKLLNEKGFEITDKEKIVGYLEKVGYNRLFYYFLDAPGDIERVISLYIFDKRLRLLSLDMLEVIENGLKSILIYQLGELKHGNFRYLNYDIYQKDSVAERLGFIWQKINQLTKSDPSAKAYFSHNQNEKETRLPDYIFFDKLTFGEIVKIILDLNYDYQKIIANYFEIPPQIFIGWMTNLKYFRNLCSHYENIFNRKMTYSIKSEIILEKLGTNNTFISYFAILSLFNKILIPNFDRDKKVIDLMDKFNISFENIGQTKNPPSELQGEAWEVLVNSLYGKYIKKSNKNEENVNS